MKYVIANLKMNLITPKECDRYIEILNQVWKKHIKNDTVKLIVCPSPLYTQYFSDKLPSDILLGSQNSFWEDKGSFTGEISPLSLHTLGVKAVICGHSESRLYSHESHDDIARKVASVIRHKMIAIVCVGETQEERDQDSMIQVIEEQLISAFASLEVRHFERVIIAYEPRWAIGTDVTPTTQDIMQMRIVIQKILIKQYGSEMVQKVAIVYGGSVSASNMSEVCIDADMSGVLVGRESLNASELIKMLESLSR